MPSAIPITKGMPSAVAVVSPNDTPPIIPLPATIPQGTFTASYTPPPPPALAPPADGPHAGVPVKFHAELDPRLLDRLQDVGVGNVGESPRSRVHEVGLQSAVRERGGHLQADRARLDDHRHLGLVQDRIPLHRATDVLHVVEPVEVAPRYARVLVVEPGGDDQRVEGHPLAAGDPNGLGGKVQGIDP